MSIATVELDAEISLGFRKRELALVCHRALDQYFSSDIDYPHRNARGCAAVGKATLAGDGVVAIVVAVAYWRMRIGEADYPGYEEQK